MLKPSVNLTFNRQHFQEKPDYIFQMGKVLVSVGSTDYHLLLVRVLVHQNMYCTENNKKQGKILAFT